MTLCWIPSRAPYENCCREVAPQCFLLQLKSVSEKFGREVAPPHFHFQSKSASHAEVAPLHFFFQTDFPFSHYRRGRWSRHIGPQKESHVLSTYKRQEHASKTRAKHEKHVRNTRATCEKHVSISGGRLHSSGTLLPFFYGDVSLNAILICVISRKSYRKLFSGKDSEAFSNFLIN